MKIRTKEMGGVRQRDIEIKTASAVGRKLDRAEKREIEDAIKKQLSASDRRKWDRMPEYEKEKLIREALKDTADREVKSTAGRTATGGGTPDEKRAASSAFLRYKREKGSTSPDGGGGAFRGRGSSGCGSRATSGGGFGESGSSSSGTGSGSYGFGAAAPASTTISSSAASKAAGAAAEVTKDTAATAASGGTHLAVKAVKKSLEAAKKVAESVKRKIEPKDYEAQNQRMGYGQPMEQNANGTTGSRKAVDKVKPLIAAASISVMPIVVAISMTVMILFLFMAPLFGFGSTDAVYPPSEAMADGDYALIKAEMEQYIGMPYVWAGDRPETSFDCSGLTAWVYGRALGISLPHSAQGQYDMSIPVAPEDAKPGDLVFFHSTYETDKYITHVGIYAGEGIMFEAGGGGVKYTDLNTSYWKEHFAGFGRVTPS